MTFSGLGREIIEEEGGNLLSLLMWAEQGAKFYPGSGIRSGVRMRLAWKLPSGWFAVFEEDRRSWQHWCRLICNEKSLVLSSWQKSLILFFVLFSCCHCFIWLICKCIWQIPSLIRGTVLCRRWPLMQSLSLTADTGSCLVLFVLTFQSSVNVF